MKELKGLKSMKALRNYLDKRRRTAREEYRLKERRA